MRLLLVLSAALVAGCSWSDVLVKEGKSLPAGSSFGYSQGFNSGCKSGIAEHGKIGFDKPRFTRDDQRIQSEPDYRKGWEEGRENCANKYAGFPPYYPPADGPRTAR